MTDILKDFSYKNLLTASCLEQLSDFKKIWVGFSGGMDSSVLLHQLTSIPVLAEKISAVHVNHGLSQFALDWQRQCDMVCDKLNVPFVSHQVTIKDRSNIEEQARLARYKVFEAILAPGECLVLAHHAQDQAETLLLHLFRGTGIDGLAAMPRQRLLGQGTLLRPFLHLRQEAIKTYAQRHQLNYIEDESNQDSAYSRNFLRHQILPLLQEKWPGVISNLTSCASLCQDARENLDELAQLDCHPLASDATRTLSIETLPLQDRARLMNVLRVWFKQNRIQLPSAKLLNQVIDELITARPDATPRVVWSGVAIRRFKQTLYLQKNETMPAQNNIVWTDFPSPCKLKDGRTVTASLAEQGLLIRADSHIEIRFRQGGERFKWHGQTKCLKKLFQAWQIPPWQRAQVPLIYVDDCLKGVVGFAMADNDNVTLDHAEKMFTFELR